MIVVDVNTIACLWLPSEHSKAADDLLKADHEWAAPFLWRSEFKNVLAGYLRLRHYSLSQITEIVLKAEELLRGKEYIVKSASALSLLNQSCCSAYDCEYVALANELDTKLITYDKKVIKEFPAIAMTAEHYLTAYPK